MNTQSNITNIARAISQGYNTAIKISKNIGLTKAEVNRILYLNEGKLFKKTNETPPVWSHVCTENNEEAFHDNTSNNLIVLIDLGNIHHLTIPLTPYFDTVKVWFYADKSYNGPERGISHSNVRYFQDTTGRTNAADVKLIWDIASYISLYTRTTSTGNCIISMDKPTFIIATKDQGFSSIADLCKDEGIDCQIITSWDELKLYIE